LPYTFNPASLPDGALPWPWVGATFAISGGKAINTPTLGAELLTDPGLEATYTDGKCGTLTLFGTPTLTDGAPDVHGGSHAQQIVTTAGNQWLRMPSVTPVAFTWYLCSMWEKLIAGASSADFKGLFSTGTFFPSGGAGYGMLINNVAWAQKKSSFVVTTTDAITFYVVYNQDAAAHTAIVDDGSVKALTYSTLFSMIQIPVSRLATVKIQPAAIADGTVSGVVAWGNANASPTTYLMATVNRRYSENLLEIGLMKCVGGTYTQVIDITNVSEVANAWLEIRPVDNDTVGLYYNNTQISTNKDVTDVPGTYSGFFISGGNNVKGFFVG
jgi:hypothetical protein